MTPLLAARGLTLGYPDHADVLVSADLAVTAGARMSLLGANGSGKSTLMRALAGALEPRSGEVLLDGTVLRHRRRDLIAHRRRVQLVLQDPDDQLFSADVFQDVSFGPTNLGLGEAEVRERVGEALTLLGVAHLAERATHHLSYGERKRVATAGAVAMRPDVLILDEPTAGLDPAGTGLVLEALARLHDHGATLLVATHDVDLALAWSDTVAVVVGGGIVSGPTLDVLADDDLIHRARLRLPWPLWTARQLGLDAAPRDGAALVEALQRSISSGPSASGPSAPGNEAP